MANKCNLTTVTLLSYGNHFLLLVLLLLRQAGVENIGSGNRSLMDSVCYVVSIQTKTVIVDCPMCAYNYYTYVQYSTVQYSTVQIHDT